MTEPGLIPMLCFLLLDINECLSNNGGCSQTCVNSAGSHRCSCATGYILDSFGRICLDINECLRDNGNCAQTCNNMQGKYRYWYFVIAIAMFSINTYIFKEKIWTCFNKTIFWFYLLCFNKTDQFVFVCLCFPRYLNLIVIFFKWLLLKRH